VRFEWRSRILENISTTQRLQVETTTSLELACVSGRQFAIWTLNPYGLLVMFTAVDEVIEQRVLLSADLASLRLLVITTARDFRFCLLANIGMVLVRPADQREMGVGRSKMSVSG
jgi:hypothetical protein